MEARTIIVPQYTRDSATVRALAMCGVRGEADSLVIVQRLYSPWRPVGEDPEAAFQEEAQILLQIIGAIGAAAPEIFLAPDEPDGISDF
jgi:hypothetical protein